MIDWTQVLAAVGVSAPLAVPLGIALRFAVPILISFVRGWLMDRGLKRAAGLIYSYRLASGISIAPTASETDSDAWMANGTAYMRLRLAGTIRALGIPDEDVSMMVQAAYGELMAGLSMPRKEVEK